MDDSEPPSNPLENIVRKEKSLTKHHPYNTSRLYGSKILNQTRLHNYWKEHPILHAPLAALLYIGGRLTKKL